MRTFTTITLLLLASAAQAQVPPPSDDPVPKGAYTLDKPHSSLTFRVNHLGFSKFTGRFTTYDAKLQFDPADPATARVDVTIDPTSITTDNAPDGFLQELATGDGWLNADEFPEMKFVSKSVDVRGDTLQVKGELTMRGVTRPLVLEAKYNGGYASHPFESQARIGFSARGTFSRSAFGISAGVPTAGSTFGIGDDVQVILEAEFSGPAAAVAQR